MDEIELASEEITDWLQNNLVTKEFFKKLREIESDYDNKVHLHLAKHEHQEAAYFNAGLDAIKEVLNGPRQMIEELKEKEKNEDS